MRILTIISGVLLTAAGIFCFMNPGATFLSIAFVLGIAMLFSGISSITSFFVDRKTRLRDVTQWRLADGFVTTVLGLVVLSNQLVTDAMIPIFFGMWVLFSGTLRILASYNLKERGVVSWKWGLLWGILSVAVGMASFIRPIVATVAISMIVGAFFLLQGVNVIILGIHMKRVRKRKKEDLEDNDRKEDEIV
ncbi:MAG: HdeD family acid-resistance protein [Anaerovorax sp.]|nr:HdeD family acid-resistance protein [Anaerovorax sp.]